MTFGQAFRISIEVRVVVDKLAISAQLINGYATAFALEEFYDGSVRRGNYGSSPGSRYINRVMNASFRARFREGISQLLRPHPGNRNDQFRRRLWRRCGNWRTNVVSWRNDHRGSRLNLGGVILRLGWPRHDR